MAFRDLLSAGQPRRLVLLAILFAAAGFAALAIDLPAARVCHQKKEGEKSGFQLPGDVRKAINLTEFFGHGFGVGVIVLAVYVLDRPGRRYVPRILVCAFGSGLAANGVKMLIERTRPGHFLKSIPDQASASVWDTFQGFLPLTSAGSGGQSTPSAHAATTVGLALALSWRYPHGRWLFIVCATLACCQRIVHEAHFVSDTLWGVASACLVAAACLYTRWGGGLFDRLERVDR